MSDSARTERFESFFDEETKVVYSDPLPSEQREQLAVLVAEVRRLSAEISSVVGQLNAARSDINRIDHQLAQTSIDVRTMGMTLAGIDGPVRAIRTHLEALGAKLQGV